MGGGLWVGQGGEAVRPASKLVLEGLKGAGRETLIADQVESLVWLSKTKRCRFANGYRG